MSKRISSAGEEMPSFMNTLRGRNSPEERASLGILAGLQLLVTPVVQGLHNPGVGAEAVLGIALW
jgi:hypothetical protein